MQPPFAIIALLKEIICRLFRRGSSLPPINWRETMEHACARFFVGLVVGFGLCLLLVPLVFWPGQRQPRSMWDQLGHPGWGSWIFVAALAGSALIGLFTTRVTFRYRDPLGDLVAGMSSDIDDRAKTWALGILIPLFFAAYGIYTIKHPWEINRITGRMKDPDVVISTGILALGMAVVAHALGFVAYERIPFLKWVIAAAGVGLCFYGLTWPHRG
jgi:hypothetical protein